MANHVAKDRPNIQPATKDISRSTAGPTSRGVPKLKWLDRHVLGILTLMTDGRQGFGASHRHGLAG
eukprot:12458052-Alexandrium_andersonii.AAC.1